MKTKTTKTNPQTATTPRRYVLIDQYDKSVYESKSFSEIGEIANTTQLLKIYEVFWIGERLDDYTVSVWHEYHKSGAHKACVCKVETMRPNKDNRQKLLEDINYYSSRKDLKKELLKDLKKRSKTSENKEHFDKKIKELEEIFKIKKTDKLYICNYTGATVRKVGKKYRAANGFTTSWHMKAVTIKHDSCGDTVGSTYEYKISDLTKIKNK